MNHVLSVAKYSLNWRYLAVLVEILLYRKRRMRIINVTLWSEKKRKFPVWNKGVSHLWNAMIPPYMCTEDVKTLHTTALSNCGKPMFTYLGGKIHKCMKCSLHMYPTNSPSMSPREKLFIYLFIGLKTAKQA